ncbi:MAG: serine hydrolase [Pseudomonadota bacterium]
MKDGKVVGERYADGFGAETPLLGWSMAKTVTGALVGVMEKDGLTTRETTGLFPQWKGDARAKVSVGDMLGMVSSLKWNEGYGTVSDVTRMLYLENDMAAFATKAGLEPAKGEKIGEVFNYSSGTSVALSAYLQSLFPTPKDGISYLQSRLLDPIGMTSAIVETDATGTMVGGSYIYATARDWARFGQFLLDGGRAQGELLVPEEYVSWMTTAHPASQSGAYGQGHIWRLPPNRRHNETGVPFAHKAWWLAGHDSQSVGIVPDKNLVVVRMGLTPSKLKYRPAPLTSAIIEALEK